MIIMVSKMDRQEQIFSIQQVSSRLNIPKATLRFWEKELDGIIVPIRTQGGQRRYTVEHISIIKDIVNLKKRKMRLTEIKRKISNIKKFQNDNSNFDKVDLLADHVAEIVRAVVYSFFEK